jgi:integrase
MSNTKRAKKQWPRIYTIPREGRQVYQVDLRAVDGGRPIFDTKEAADTCAEQARIARNNEDISFFFALPQQVKLDAVKGHEILRPFGASLIDAATYYKTKYLVFKTAPLIKDIVARLIKDKTDANKRPRTLSDLRHRLQHNFAAKFGEKHLTDLTIDDLKNWLLEVKDFRTRTNCHAKGSQLFSYAKKHKWIDENLFEYIDKPQIDEKPTEVFKVEDCQKLLITAQALGLPYISIGLFAGIRDEELKRLRGKHFNFDTHQITLGGDVAKKRRWRIIEMEPALIAWLEAFKDKIKGEFRIAEQNKQQRTRKGVSTSTNLTLGLALRAANKRGKASRSKESLVPDMPFSSNTRSIWMPYFHWNDR